MTVSSPPTFRLPYDPLTPIRGKPSYATVERLRREMMANALSVSSPHWGGRHGHVFLLLSDAEFEALANAPAVALVHPGPHVEYPPNATSAQRADANRAYDTAVEDYERQEYVHNLLRQLVNKAVEPMYLMPLRTTVVGLGRVDMDSNLIHIRDILAYLVDNYTTITAAEIESNRASLLSAWSPDQPIQALWNRHLEIREFAEAAGEPLSDRTMMDQTLALLTNIGHGSFQSAMDAWRRRSAADKTYANFVEHFTAEHAALQEQRTTSAAGYHHANAAGAAAPPLVPPAPHLAAASGPSVAPSNPFEVVCHGGFKMHYCWTHGLGLNPQHTSQSCNNPGDGHVRTATLQTAKDTKGSTRINLGGRRPPPAPAAAPAQA
jgi:hypothetical protein